MVPHQLRDELRDRITRPNAVEIIQQKIDTLEAQERRRLLSIRLAGDEYEALHILCRPCRSVFERLLVSRSRRLLHETLSDLQRCASETGCHFCTAVSLDLQDGKKYRCGPCRNDPPSLPGLSICVVRPTKSPQYLDEADDLHLKVALATDAPSYRTLAELRYDWGTIQQPPDDYFMNPSMAVSTASEAHKVFAERQIERCENEHAGCTRRDPKTLPSRLISIGRMDGIFKTKLILTDPSRKYRYCTLSYAWGGVEDALKLRDENLKRWQDDLPFHDLPQCYQDAIEVTFGLHVYYLWIDALCIIQEQPSKEDFMIEGLKMGDIYTGSWCTIAATNTANPKEPLFQRRQPRQQSPCVIRLPGCRTLLVQAPKESILQRADEVLSARGWCMQESILSPRVLFMGKEVRFGCNTVLESENLSFGEEFTRPVDNAKFDEVALKNVGFKERYRFPLIEMRNQQITKLDVHHAWAKLVLQYSARSFGNPNDLLLALSGVAQRMQTDFGADIRAGVLLDTFPLGLLWIPSEWEGAPSWRCEEYRAPSWSWASCHGLIRHDPWDQLWKVDMIAPFQIQTKLHYSPQDRTQTGKVLGGTLDVDGELQEIFATGESTMMCPFGVDRYRFGVYFAVEHDGIHLNGAFWLDFRHGTALEEYGIRRRRRQSWEDNEASDEEEQQEPTTLYMWPLMVHSMSPPSGSGFLGIGRGRSFEEARGLLLELRGDRLERIGLALVQTKYSKKRPASLAKHINKHWPRRKFSIC